jgi:ADP-L-glycero-D-manno-heptose 6-epimerase
MRILVTGGGGFIGQHLVRALTRIGHEVTVITSGSETELTGVKKILYTTIDGLDWNAIAHPYDAIFHQMANNDTRCQDRDEMWRANVTGPLKLFEFVHQWGCRNFIYASSTAVYGAEPAPYVENQTPIKPLNVYAESKAAFEKEVVAYLTNQRDSKSTGLRYCNVYGPGEERKGKRMSMIGQILRAVLKWQRPRLFANGEQRRDWIYVEDVVQANLLAINRTKGSAHEIYNCGSGTASSFNEIATIAKELVRISLPTEYFPCPFETEYQNHTECDVKKAGEEMAFFPSFNLRTGMEEYFTSLQS